MGYVSSFDSQWIWILQWFKFSSCITTNESQSVNRTMELYKKVVFQSCRGKWGVESNHPAKNTPDQ